MVTFDQHIINVQKASNYQMNTICFLFWMPFVPFLWNQWLVMNNITHEQ